MCEKTMALMIGIQGSGKSTFCQEHLSSFCRINLDTLKTRYQEQLAIDECFKCGKNFVIDNTNSTIEERKKYILQAKKEGYKIIGYFLESKIKDCIERNNRRVGKACIPAKVIAATSNRLQLPSYDEGFDKSVSYKNELLFSRGINFDKLPLWQKRGVGIYWDEIEKTGYNPIKNIEEKAIRRELKVDMNLELGEKYGILIENLLG